MANDDRDELPAESGERASGPLVKRRASGSEPALDPYRDFGGSDDDAGAEAGFDLRAILRIGWKRKWVIVASVAACLVSAFLWTLTQKAVYTAAIRLEIAHSAPRVLVGRGGDAASEVDESGFDTEIALMKSSRLGERVAAMTPALRDPEPAPASGADSRGGPSGSERAERRRATASSILGCLAVKPVPGTHLIDVSCTDADPARAQMIANAFGEAYVAASLEKRFQANTYAKTFLEDQLNQLKLRLEEAEKAQVAFAEKEQVVAATDKGSIAETDLAAATSALGGLVSERIKNELLWRQAESASGINVPQLLSNGAIDGLRGRRGALVAEYQEKSETFRADYPGMTQLANKIKEIDRQLGVEVNAVKASLKAAYEASFSQEKEMKERIEKLRADVLIVQKRSIKYGMLKHEVESTRSLYESLLQRYKELDVASGVATNSVFIIEKAQLPGAPNLPSTSRTMLMALALGLLIGAAGAYLLEQFDDVIYSAQEAEQATGLTLLGAIPKVGRGQSFLAALADPRSPVAEALQSTCTSLHFSTEDGVPKTLMVTSATPGEGKSSTALGLARQFTGTGLKVLVVDADLRKPSLHDNAGLDNSVGLTTYLTRNCEAAAAVKQTDHANLYVMTSGPLPPNPVELLHGPRFASLLSASAEIFDLIILDGPPVMGLADALVLSNLVRATLFIIGAGEGRIRLVRQALKRLTLARSRPLGIIITKVDQKFSHGYGYGYGYGDRDGQGKRDDNETAPSGELEDASDGRRKLDNGAAVA